LKTKQFSRPKSPDTEKDTVFSDPADTGQRIQRLRLVNSWSQAQLSETAAVATGLVSMIEHGRHGLDSDSLQRVADSLECAPEYLARPSRQPITTRPWLRAYADASKKAVDRYVADTEVAVEAIESLRLKRLPELLPTFDDDLNDDHAIEEFARDVRSAAGLQSDDVVGNCIRRAERLGVVVLPMDDELGRHLGLSMRVDGIPVIRASRPRLDQSGLVSPSGDRQRFTVAHELGHLALHATTPPPSTAHQARLVEQQAHRFAGAFLAPAEPLLSDLDRLGGRVTLSTLARLKEIWGVAIKMLVVRLRQLGLIDDQHARSLYKQISARKWNTSEPVAVSHEQAVWLEQALSRAHLGAHSAADALGLDVRYVRTWLNWDLDTSINEDLPEGVLPIRRPASKHASTHQLIRR
jgi:transcriptional regulator with XRE-family HTH domain